MEDGDSIYMNLGWDYLSSGLVQWFHSSVSQVAQELGWQRLEFQPSLEQRGEINRH